MVCGGFSILTLTGGRCGDFNYRIDLPNDECKQLIAQQNWSTLLTFDQLTQERQQSKVFGGFIEAPIAFAPTYKFEAVLLVFLFFSSYSGATLFFSFL